MLLRSLAAEPHASLGALLTKVNRSLRAGWIDGLSGSVHVGLVALADGAAEWVEAGPVTGVVVRARGAAEDLGAHAPPVGEDVDQEYESITIVLGDGDRIVALTDTLRDPTASVSAVLTDAREAASREALTRVLGRLDPVSSGGPDDADVSAAVMTRTTPPRINPI